MPYSAIFIPNYLTISLRQPKTTIAAATTSLHLRRRFHFCSRKPRRLFRPQPLPPPLVALKLHRGLDYWRQAFAATCLAPSSSGLYSTPGFSASLPYFHYQDSPYGRLAYDEYASEDDSDRAVESGQLGASTLDNIEEWKWKLTVLMRNKDEQEVVSMERKDRRDFDHLSILATRMGLYSRQYTKVVVVSKVPLPNYRSDLDDKRPQREVVLPFGLQREVDVHLERYISSKSVNKEYFLDNTLSRSSSFCSIYTGEGVHEQEETLIKHSIAAEKILRPKSLQLCNKQQDWQVISA
ncbi:DExH-box ATP-dependent RNA helicase [Actinidia chinensis var. chinensis]|uniref:DExH-box ATP-dependent RNA helicase n=1 Tax=Actinidia chinensis var. chinensis TaxID=1590841 RepID=A0A2R6QHU8_ACTCC|nr:DExH-box ATP-dependent RNA helicase [Actinidia chinensis var. chinensis]